MKKLTIFSYLGFVIPYTFRVLIWHLTIDFLNVKGLLEKFTHFYVLRRSEESWKKKIMDNFTNTLPTEKGGFDQLTQRLAPFMLAEQLATRLTYDAQQIELIQSQFVLRSNAFTFDWEEVQWVASLAALETGAQFLSMFINLTGKTELQIRWALGDNVYRDLIAMTLADFYTKHMRAKTAAT